MNKIREYTGNLLNHVEALPLKEAVVEKWLYGNARRFLRLP